MAAPEPKLIRSPGDAESAAAEWLRFFGFPDAQVTPPGADRGVDVASVGVVAQVKAEMKPTGRPVIQQLYGVAAHRGTRSAVFSLAGSTDEAIEWADEAGVALFSFDLQGRPQPDNASAGELLASDNSDAWSHGLDVLLATYEELSVQTVKHYKQIGVEQEPGTPAYDAAFKAPELEQLREDVDEAGRRLRRYFGRLGEIGKQGCLDKDTALGLLFHAPSHRSLEPHEIKWDRTPGESLILVAVGVRDVVLLAEHCAVDEGTLIEAAALHFRLE